MLEYNLVEYGLLPRQYIARLQNVNALQTLIPVPITKAGLCPGVQRGGLGIRIRQGHATNSLFIVLN